MTEALVWLLTAFGSDDELVWAVDLPGADQQRLEKALDIADLSRAEVLPLTIDQARVALAFANPESRPTFSPEVDYFLELVVRT